MPEASPPRSQQSYRHEAFLWSDAREYTSFLTPFIEEGIAAGEPVMVAVIRPHATWLQNSLGASSGKVKFVDMARLGHNPARIIPGWQQFLAAHAADGRPVRGIGEPIWSGRRPEELIECQLHEALLNVAVDPSTPFWLVCPYAVRGLDDAVIAEAYRSHPAVIQGDQYQGNMHYAGRSHVDWIFGSPLPALPTESMQLTLTSSNVRGVVDVVTLAASTAGFWSDKVTNLAAAVRRLAAGRLRRGASQATVKLWDLPQELIFEVSDDTAITDVMIGRQPPKGDDLDGLWSANQLCDLVQVRSTSSWSTIRLYAWK
jgi:hypothetical protein